MDVLSELFRSPIGLLSLFTIAFVIGMAIFLFFWVKKQTEKDKPQRITDG